LAKSNGADALNNKDAEKKIRGICRKVLQKAIPDDEEAQKTITFSKNLVARLQRELEKARFKAEAHVEGSIAKDTWLAGEKDIDLFILIPLARGREAFTDVLAVAKKVAGKDFLKAYAEHPYIQAEIEGFTVDFVPCFKLDSANQVESAVDRTPFHTLYIIKRLTAQAKNEVRLLKRFMRGTGCYGAEIKVGGFSGYLCELLVLYYGGFTELLRAASNWQQGEIIALEGQYQGREKEVRQIFREPLIVVDPVDEGRNVASAVNPEKLSEFIAASRMFLSKPSIEFFYPEPAGLFSVDELFHALDSRESAFVFLQSEVAKAVPDVLWGQLYKSLKTMTKMIRGHGFAVMRDGVWSDEKSTVVFVFELNSHVLPAAEKHVGPPVSKKEDSEKFLKKYLKPGTALSGPRIEGDRWVVDRKRRHTNVVEFLREKLGNGGQGTGIASLVSKAFSSSLNIWVNHEVKTFYSKNPAFASFLTEHLLGKPSWLRKMHKTENRAQLTSQCRSFQ
jgi:tRNA nucleotidyltransferase (CCA-adding enzyme)